MREIVFVTSNSGKIASAKRDLSGTGLEVVQMNYDLVEPRSESIEEIAAYKLKQAYDLVGKECIVLDSSFSIEALKGWPGTFINHNLYKLGINGFLKLMDGENNRICYFRECLGYFDGQELKYFYGECRGLLSNEIRGRNSNKKWSDLWYIFQPGNMDITLAEMDDEERNAILATNSTSAIKEFANHVKIYQR